MKQTHPNRGGTLYPPPQPHQAQAAVFSRKTLSGNPIGSLPIARTIRSTRTCGSG